MNKCILLIPIIVVAIGCKKRVKDLPNEQRMLTTIDYLTVGKIMDTIQPPYVINLKNGNKRVTFIGCDHNHDSTHIQYKVIEKYFTELSPQIAFNEGGQIKDSVHFKSLAEAAANDGETGSLKYLSDNAGIRMMNGDVNDSLEFSIMLHKHRQDQLFLYYIMERLVIPYLSGAYGNRPFEEFYAKVIQKWFINQGFPLTKEQQSFEYFKLLYKQYTGNPFELKLTEDIEKFDYINGGDCHFCAIGRSSKMLRDSILLNKIDQSLNQYDRVFITFGHGHAIALEPALRQIITKKRE